MVVQSNLHWIRKFSNEMWIFVFQSLDTYHLSHVRLVCQLFASLAMPLQYRATVLRPDLSYMPGDGHNEQSVVHAARNRHCIELIERITSPDVAWRVERLVLSPSYWHPPPTQLPLDIKWLSHETAMENLLNTVEKLSSITYMEFVGVPVSVELLCVLCSVTSVARRPLSRLVISSNLEENPVAAEQLRIQDIEIWGNIGEHPDYFHRLLHPDITTTLELHPSDDWDETLFSPHHPPLRSLTNLRVIAEQESPHGVVDILLLARILHCCPALKRAEFGAVEFTSFPDALAILPTQACPRLETLVAQMHVASALLQCQSVQKLCLLGVPTDDNLDDPEDDPYYNENLELYVNDSHVILSCISHVTSQPALQVLYFLARDLPSELLSQIWTVFPNLAVLDVRVTEDDDTEYLCDLCDIIWHLEEMRSDGDSQSTFPSSLERLTLYGVKMEGFNLFESIGLQPNRGDALNRLGLTMDRDEAFERIGPAFAALRSPNLRHVELVSLVPKEVFLLDPRTGSHALEKTPVEEWVPYAKAMNVA